MKKILLIMFALMFSCSFAKNYDFSKQGNDASNEILKEFIRNDLNGYDAQVVSYFHDLDNDGVSEIIGIVKSQVFYTPEGYCLLVLKKSDENWHPLNSDVKFDVYRDFSIEKDEITFYKTIFYKNKKFKAKIKDENIRTTKSPGGFFFNKKADNIARVTNFTENPDRKEYELKSIPTESQKAVNINYTNLNERTKHYLDLK